ncbi:hypothetical protein ATANTOWER_001195 [Ataeniobius toweri]|uniref:Uncharacterized protein n=1 Tax=Ataeniobius toweri TaxID=208326 RepID=A0ABU7BDW1_9TELE|nr:hypothetical protein [Ataeniobius toweri]
MDLSLVQHASFSLPLNVSSHCELYVCLRPRPPAACFIWPDTCYGVKPRDRFLGQHSPAPFGSDNSTRKFWVCPRDYS